MHPYYALSRPPYTPLLVKQFARTGSKLTPTQTGRWGGVCAVRTIDALVLIVLVNKSEALERADFVDMFPRVLDNTLRSVLNEVIKKQQGLQARGRSRR
jgi:hypothetical protein